eukprot:TRINITY_DN32092_c0_g1_i1.p1 TRINITY_DN32092_c0_g1~~TRINITY_DN32092_c0_g1_i1.p1  ORF type:complete len:347 (-),score=69.22 TRINITY_DN32092_c0_g1_i1:297-1337(-)
MFDSMSRRDEVWEGKRQAFFGAPAPAPFLGGAVPGLAAAAPVGGRMSPGMIETGPSSYAPPAAPVSPLSRLVQDGYQAGSRGFPGQPAAAQPGGFNAGIAEQWANNLQQTTAAYQQQNDPTFVKLKKPTGYRVTNAPGGGSSLSLAWDGEQGGGGEVGGAARRYRSPGLPVSGGSVGSTASRASRGFGGGSDGGMAGCLGGASYRDPSPQARRAPPGGGGGGVGGCIGGAGMRAASPSGGHGYERGRPPMPGGMAGGRAPSPYGGGSYGQAAAVVGGGGNFGAQAPPRMPASRAAEPTGLSFGNREERSSNSYANGANQNCGNVICDRRTTRVLQAPGGSSQISFG